MSALFGRISVVLLFAACAAAAASARSSESGGQAFKPPPIIVTRNNGTLPRACSGPRGVALVVARFTDAFDRGDRRRLKRFFDFYFQRYSVSEETDRGWTAVTFSHRRVALLRYFSRRHMHHEQLSPLVIAATAFGRGLPNAVSVSFWLTRSADDLSAEGINQTLAYGKGIIDCRRKTIVQLNFALPRAAPVPAPYWPYLEGCPTPDGWSPARGIIACVGNG